MVEDEGPLNFLGRVDQVAVQPAMLKYSESVEEADQYISQITYALDNIRNESILVGRSHRRGLLRTFSTRKRCDKNMQGTNCSWEEEWGPAM